MIPSVLYAAFLVAVLAVASSLQKLDTRATTLNPFISDRFPDPVIFQDTGGMRYAFSTNNDGKNVPVADGPAPAGPWSVLSNDLMPTPGSWPNGQNV